MHGGGLAGCSDETNHHQGKRFLQMAMQVFKHLLDVLLPFSHHRMDASIQIVQAELASSLTVHAVLKRLAGRR
jgi:hypothetical protein